MASDATKPDRVDCTQEQVEIFMLALKFRRPSQIAASSQMQSGSFKQGSLGGE